MPQSTTPYCPVKCPNPGATSLTRDASSSVAELRRLVDSAGIAKPFVLVGHSLGANIAQVYGASHRQNLEGIVLVDPADR